MSQEVGFGGANFGFGGGKIQVVFWKAFEKGSDVGLVGGGVGVVDDDIVKVSYDALEAFDDLVDYLVEPPGGSVVTLRYDEPLEEPVRCAEGGWGNGILVNGNLVKGGDEVEQGKDASFSRGSRRREGWGVVRASGWRSASCNSR